LPAGQPRQLLPYPILDSKGNTLSTPSLNLAFGDQVRVHYIAKYTWDLAEPSSVGSTYQLQDGDGNNTIQVPINAGDRVRVTRKYDVLIVDKVPPQ
jgi:hypothetical protein